MLGGELGQVDQSVEIREDTCERAELCHGHDRCLEFGSDLIGLDQIPGIVLFTAIAEGDAALLLVEILDEDGDLIADLQDFCRVVDALSSETCTMPSTPPRSTNAP